MFLLAYHQNMFAGEPREPHCSVSRGCQIGGKSGALSISGYRRRSGSQILSLRRVTSNLKTYQFRSIIFYKRGSRKRLRRKKKRSVGAVMQSALTPRLQNLTLPGRPWILILVLTTRMSRCDLLDVLYLASVFPAGAIVTQRGHRLSKSMSAINITDKNTNYLVTSTVFGIALSYKVSLISRCTVSKSYDIQNMNHLADLICVTRSASEV